MITKFSIFFHFLRSVITCPRGSAG